MLQEKEIKSTDTLDSGAYEIIRKRLLSQKEELSSRLKLLNEARKEVFNSTSFVLKANQRITTENNCEARGIVALDKLCIFGYNVHFGLRNEINLADVFSIYTFENDQFIPQSLDLINDANFTTDYQNLYKYYRDSIFSKFRRTENYLYMIFQTSKNPEDLKAFKWLIKDRKLHYQDDRSIHEVKLSPQFEFDWIKTILDDRRLGKFPHMSILDKVFIEALHGNITFKIEDNTESGKGIYSEKVSNLDQQLDDAEYYYADLGNLIAIRIKPYQEEFRAYVFNVRTKEVINLSSLNESAILLPDNQGIIFSNGYYLQNGTHKIFDAKLDNVSFLRKIASPNGEDYLYIFTQRSTNTYILMSYNIIQQAVETPIVCNGYTIFKDGSLIYFRTDPEATRHHQVQIWETPYMAILQENEDRKEDPLYKVGNKQIVQAMAESQEVIQLVNKEDSYEGLYEDILKKTTSLLDSYFWIKDEALKNLGQPLIQIQEVANAAIDEFVKVQAQRKHAEELLHATEERLENLTFKVNSTVVNTLDQLVHQLADSRRLQGEVIDLKNIKYVDIQRVDMLLEKLSGITSSLSTKTVEFLLRDEALVPYEQKVSDQKGKVEEITKVFDARAIEEANSGISGELELLIDILNSLKIEDATQTTKIIEKISVIFSSLNEVRAQLTRKLNSLKSKEAIAEFSAQLTLLEQSVTNYLELSTSAEKVEEYYTKIVVHLEEIESKFSEFDDFALKIADKRDDVIKAFNSRREQIVEQKNKRTSSLEQIGLRVLKNIENKSKTLTSRNEILSFYASDLMIGKIRQLVSELKTLDDISKAENLENQLKKSQEDALRILRDKTELYVDGENIIALGKHKFAVNNQSLSLTLLRRNDELFYHLTGTNFYQKVGDSRITAYKDIWEQELVSENAEVYRAEYLAYKTFMASQQQRDFNAEQFITQNVEQNYSESYVKGVHNFDALQIFRSLKQLDEKLDLLRYDSHLRATAQLFWHSLPEDQREKLSSFIHSSHAVLKVFPHSKRYQSVIDKIVMQFNMWETALDLSDTKGETVATYLFKTFTKYGKLVLSENADQLKREFYHLLENKKSLRDFQSDLENEQYALEDRFYLIVNWLDAFIDENTPSEIYRMYIEETATVLLFPKDDYQLIFSKDEADLEGLKGNHSILNNGHLHINYHNFIQRLANFTDNKVPRFEDFLKVKEQLSKGYEKELKIHEFEPKVLTSFVRNKLINEVYFPLIGNNLAKQLGAAGDNKRTARMGMLLLISPPGYGKTTLMEYLAKTMGLHFVKINGPTIGHSITSIDPVEAKTSGEREELKKINLAFEMADNVMLYLDDIQHLNTEFLQKFISLADGQRKMDGIFEGESKTYDLRGKRFCIVMAGNPYTESGSKFQIPDMLANRADVYNLGDVIGDTEHLFNLSLIENAAIENPYLEKIASKSFTDFYALIEVAQSSAEQLPDLEGNYLKQEIDDFVAVLKHILTIRNLVVKVNRNYIQSAAMQDDYRTEPAFKMQGSYRNMNKLVASVVPMMNSKEIDELILAHYESESQTLTADTESNLLKLKELAGLITAEEQKRWTEIKEIFRKNNKHNGLNKDDKVFAQLLEFNDNLEGIIHAIRGK
ncbi:AAA family ATPase [Sphingobacterium alkalisoli]|uniref:AAA family ATPase n=1 Tax=Sphingobacterium alkalisoli TaxID=1874115 RepID=A0A4U0GYV5_9SPHI|nr:DNA repair ATPase [Sphingobacterium alkalisoli]TJY64417.1 AAA family ATPase [Sphingobacterium alkalisoli]GGH21881.1 ATPase AAA [Sphingobacterium alkalisoli]